jgi:hypothetical protein
MSKPNIVITCAACQHQNEPERVYCHNCGQKLDRSLVPQATQAAAAAGEAEQNRKRVQKMMSVNRGKTMRDVKTAAKILVFAATVAAVVQFFRKPEDVTVAKMDAIPDRLLGEAWPGMMAHPGAITIQFTENDVNYFLAKSVKAKDGFVPGTKFLRTYVKLTPGSIKVAVERDLWGLKVYSSMTFAPVAKDGGVKFNVIGVHFGRLGFHPILKSIGGLAVGAVGDAFAKELKELPRLADVQVGDGLIQFSTKPAAQ